MNNKLQTLKPPPPGSRLFRHYACVDRSDCELLIIFPPYSGVLKSVAGVLSIEWVNPIFQGGYEQEMEYRFTEGLINIQSEEIVFQHKANFKAPTIEESFLLREMFVQMINKLPVLDVYDLYRLIRIYERGQL